MEVAVRMVSVAALTDAGVEVGQGVGEGGGVGGTQAVRVISSPIMKVRLWC